MIEMEIEWRRKEIYELRMRGWTRHLLSYSAARQRFNCAESISVLQVGTRVLVPFEGKMSLGVISTAAVGENIYSIALDDGDEVSLPREEVSIPSSIHMPRILRITLDLPEVSALLVSSTLFCVFTLGRCQEVSLRFGLRFLCEETWSDSKCVQVFVLRRYGSCDLFSLSIHRQIIFMYARFTGRLAWITLGAAATWPTSP